MALKNLYRGQTSTRVGSNYEITGPLFRDKPTVPTLGVAHKEIDKRWDMANQNAKLHAELHAELHADQVEKSKRKKKKKKKK